MQRESPRALVLNPSGKISGAHAPHRIGMAQIVLDNAFDLIEGHPPSVCRPVLFLQNRDVRSPSRWLLVREDDIDAVEALDAFLIGQV
jgi:hypothetical protein